MTVGIQRKVRPARVAEPELIHLRVLLVRRGFKISDLAKRLNVAHRSILNLMCGNSTNAHLKAQINRFFGTQIFSLSEKEAARYRRLLTHNPRPNTPR